MRYDAVIILGSRPVDPSTWAFPSHVYASLDKATELYDLRETQYIIVSGKWTINFDALRISQPFRECDAMADYLVQKGVPDFAILREGNSKDVISNLYFVKRQLLSKYNLEQLLFVAASTRLPRIAFLCRKILGMDYNIGYEGVRSKPGEVSTNEHRRLRLQKTFLAPMEDGDDSWLNGKFFDDPYYSNVRAEVIEGAQNEPFLHLAKPDEALG